MSSSGNRVYDHHLATCEVSSAGTISIYLQSADSRDSDIYAVTCGHVFDEADCSCWFKLDNTAGIENPEFCKRTKKHVKVGKCVYRVDQFKFKQNKFRPIAQETGAVDVALIKIQKNVVPALDLYVRRDIYDGPCRLKFLEPKEGDKVKFWKIQEHNGVEETFKSPVSATIGAIYDNGTFSVVPATEDDRKNLCLGDSGALVVADDEGTRSDDRGGNLNSKEAREAAGHGCRPGNLAEDASQEPPGLAAGVEKVQLADTLDMQEVAEALAPRVGDAHPLAVYGIVVAHVSSGPLAATEGGDDDGAAAAGCPQPQFLRSIAQRISDVMKHLEQQEPGLKYPTLPKIHLNYNMQIKGAYDE